MAKNTNVDRTTVQLIIDGKQAQTSLKEVRLATIALESKLSNMKKQDDPAGYEAMTKDLQILYAAQKKVLAEMRGSEASFKKFKFSVTDIMAGVVGGNLATGAINAVAGGIVKLTSVSSELSDSLADVQKQTGLAGAELDSLNDELSKMDTRTSVAELRGLAAVAGKLGYQSKEEVLSFVRAAEMVGVALAEDLGGDVEEALNDMGKLVEIFGIKEQFGIEKAILKTSSAINTIGASSAANEGYMVAWSKRFAGIAPNAGISIANTLGMASTMDILGQSSELSATNLGKMIVAMGKDVPRFAKVARMDVKQFSDLLRTDANEAFIRVLEGAKSTAGGVEGLVKTLETLGIEGSEGAQVLGALTKNTELLREQQAIANKSFQEGTSIIEEYNVKNNNTAAILEKIGKKITGWWEKGAKLMDPLIVAFGKLAGVVSEIDMQLGELKAQQDKVATTEKDLVPLISRYDFLRTRVKLNADEQKELDKITRQLADAVPGAVTEFDRYGNALNINTHKVRDFVGEQRELLETMRQTRRDLLKEETTGLSSKASQLQNMLNKGTRTRVLNGPGGSVTIEEKLTSNEIKSMQAELAKVQLDIKARRQDLKALEGIADIESRRARRNGKATAAAPASPGTPTKPDGDVDLTEFGDAAKAAKDKVVDDLKKLNADILDIERQLRRDVLKEYEKEIQQVHDNYEKKKELAHGNKDALLKLAELEAKELEVVRDKYNQKNLTKFDESMRAQMKVIGKNLKEENDFKQNVQNQTDERRDGELFKVEQHYMKLIYQAEQYGFDTTQIYQLMYDHLNEIQQKAFQKQAEQTEENFKKQNKSRKKDLQEELRIIALKEQAYSDIAQSLGNLFGMMAENEAQYAEFQKAIAVVELGISTASAIASAIKAAASGSVTGWDLIVQITGAVATVTANMLKAKQLLKSSEVPDAPAFRADGGYTDMRSIMVDRGGAPEGWVNRPTLFALGKRSYVAGEAGAEYVISNPMLQNPAIADFVTMLEAVRTGAAPPPGVAASGSDPQLLQALLENNRLLKALYDKPQGGFNYAAFEDYSGVINSVRNRTAA